MSPDRRGPKVLTRINCKSNLCLNILMDEELSSFEWNMKIKFLSFIFYWRSNILVLGFFIFTFYFNFLLKRRNYSKPMRIMTWNLGISMIKYFLRCIIVWTSVITNVFNVSLSEESTGLSFQESARNLCLVGPGSLWIFESLINSV